MAIKENKIKIRRSRNRWLMVAYDTLLYVLCWPVVLSLFHQPQMSSLVSMAFGYLMFIGVRLCLHVYRMVLRTGTVAVFARLMLSDAIAGTIVLFGNFMIGLIFPGKEVLFSVLICTMGVFVLLSIAVRVFLLLYLQVCHGKVGAC